MTAIRPIRVYAGMPIAQLVWHKVEGRVLRPYSKKPGAKYAGQGNQPVPSAMWRNFKDEEEELKERRGVLIVSEKEAL
jgi:dCTP deaminase